MHFFRSILPGGGEHGTSQTYAYLWPGGLGGRNEVVATEVLVE